MASATINTGQQLGGSIGTSLLNTIFASTVASYIAAHLSPAGPARATGPSAAADQDPARPTVLP